MEKRDNEINQLRERLKIATELNIKTDDVQNKLLDRERELEAIKVSENGLKLELNTAYKKIDELNEQILELGRVYQHLQTLTKKWQMSKK